MNQKPPAIVPQATKTCLDCATKIPIAARKCPNCQEWQDEAMRNQAKFVHQAKVESATAFNVVKALLIVAGILVAGVLAIAAEFYIADAFRERSARAERDRVKTEFLESTPKGAIRKVALGPEKDGQFVHVFLTLTFDDASHKSGTLLAWTADVIEIDELDDEMEFFLGENTPGQYWDFSGIYGGESSRAKWTKEWLKDGPGWQTTEIKFQIK